MLDDTLFTATRNDTRLARERSRDVLTSLLADLGAPVPVATAPSPAASAEIPAATLHAAWASIHALAEELSGTSLDAPRRAVLYYSLYEESAGNFMFPLVATHGSLWGVRHTRRVEAVLRRLRPLSRHGSVDRWIAALDAVRDVNRRVFVEIYTTFYFTRFYGRHPAAAELVHPDVLARYNQVHEAVAAGVPLSVEARRDVYFDVFVHEQDDIVDPGVLRAAREAGSPLLLKALQRVRPRFTYFPPGERLRFTDFTDVEQRNREGLRALAFAEQVGPERVFEAMREY
jgi:hypothetical protein